MHENNNHHPPHSGWVQVELGRRKKRDPLLGVNHVQQEVILRHRTAYVAGVYLEEIEPGVSGEYVGMILLKTGWKRLYFVAERLAWKNEDGTFHFDNYFELAKRLMWKKGITVP